MPTSIAALLFHSGIFMMLGLYALFFLRLNLAQTLPAALILGLFVAGTGFNTLSGLATARLKKDLKKD